MTNKATRIRLRDLSDELGIDPNLAISLLHAACHDHGGRPPRKPFGPSTVIGMSLAGRIRALATRPSTTSRSPKPDGTAAPATAVLGLANEPLAAAGANPTSALFLAPGMDPVSGRGMLSSPAAAAAVATPQRLSEPEALPDVLTPDPDWQRRGIVGEQRERWISAGLNPTEAVLAEQCLLAGIEPDQLTRRLSGQTALSRLRGGEPATSVWARVQEGEDRGRGPGRLQGRFA